MKRLTNEEFIEKARKVHGDKYNYDHVDYKDSHHGVLITCPEHGDFSQRPNDHLTGYGCPKCVNLYRPTNEEYIEMVKSVHGDLYDYSKTEYKGRRSTIIVTCPIHGDFEINAGSHLDGAKCPMCSDYTTEGFIRRATAVHGNKYDYSKSIYVKGNQKVEIVCPKHGSFFQTPDNHINQKQGCPKCGIEKNANAARMTTEEFIRKAREVHGDKYDYSKSVYTTTDDKVIIICPTHGEFLQTPHCHISNKQGCPICNQSHLEMDVNVFLINNNVNFETYKRFDWLGRQSLDFYIPKFNIGIECQGIQHYEPDKFYDGLPGYIHRRYLDMKKQRLCREHGVTLLYFTLPEFAHFDQSAYVTTRSLLARLRQ